MTNEDQNKKKDNSENPWKKDDKKLSKNIQLEKPPEKKQRNLEK